MSPDSAFMIWGWVMSTPVDVEGDVEMDAEMDADVDAGPVVFSDGAMSFLSLEA
ncbi:hypothetical protein ACFWG0_24670 [Streptomyces yangpuensis]|uniref:hypothetical protein n=1 Tax=Streptomyces yangpuensis TaxID=1648182 RepID=UPI00364A8C23